MPKIRPDREILTRPSTHTSKCSTDTGMVVVSQKLGKKATIPGVKKSLVLVPGTS